MRPSYHSPKKVNPLKRSQKGVFSPSGLTGGLCSGEWIGLAVDALGEISQVGMDRVDSSRNAFDAQESYVECIIKPLVQSGQKDLLVVLDPTRLVKTLIGKRH